MKVLLSRFKQWEIRYIYKYIKITSNTRKKEGRKERKKKKEKVTKLEKEKESQERGEKTVRFKM